MCGIYHIGRELENGLETMLRTIARERKLEKAHMGKITSIPQRDVRPTEFAPVMTCMEEGGAAVREVRWGIPGFQKGQLLINARSETALGKKSFRAGLYNSRIVIPAVSFYEWNRQKEKSIFRRQDGRLLWMAGFCAGMGEDERFVILTTAANASMKPVHDRMPLILKEEEVKQWLFDDAKMEQLLHIAPEPLARQTEYEQMSLFGNDLN